MIPIKDKKIIQQMGYESDQDGIIRRYSNEKLGWDVHLTNTKNFIIQSAKNKNKEIVVVYGSGWLLDLPIDFLANTFKRVILVDIRHPAQVIKLTEKYKNVELVIADITGGLIDQIYKQTKNIDLDSLIYNFLEFKKYNCFTISLNILNQLDIILIDYLKQKTSFSEIRLKQFRNAIQQHHLNHLPLNNSCLITDYQEINIDRVSQHQTVKDLIFIDFPISSTIEKWQWKFDFSGNYIPGKNCILNVIAMDF